MRVPPDSRVDVSPHDRRVPLVQLRHSVGVALGNSANQLLIGWQIVADSSVLPYCRFPEHKSLGDYLDIKGNNDSFNHDVGDHANSSHSTRLLVWHLSRQLICFGHIDLKHEAH